MSGPNPPGYEPSERPAGDDREELTDTGFSRAYSAPESEQYTIAPYLPADVGTYDYDSYERSYDRSLARVEPSVEADSELPPPRWPWVVGITAILAAIALVVSVSLLVTNSDTKNVATPTTTTVKPPPVQDQITTTPPAPPPSESPAPEPPPPPETETVTLTPEPPPPPPPAPESPEPPPPAPTSAAPPPPPPPVTTTQSGPRQVTYTVTGTKAPGDIITVTYVDASGRRRTQRNVYIPWSLTVTPISQSDVGSVQASSLFLVSRLNCSITTSDGTVLSSNQNNAAQTSC
ncbi:MAG: MmpS family transport accessory protein [Mycobacteriaceae bacterium]